ncbi:MAG: ABC transporter permease subunit [Chloroflexi bacterium]|nr:ABC transporter permease subunit [Chloroflexota bacterium]
MAQTTLDGKTQVSWQDELNQVGFIRRFLRARKWYGADWWFATLSAILLRFIFSLAIFPGFYAPFGPREEVGPGLLAPGQQTPVVELIGNTANPISSLDDLAIDGARLGIVRGSESSQVFRDASEARQEELDAAGSDLRIRPRLERYDTIEDALEGLSDGEVLAVVGLSTIVEPAIVDYSNLEVVGPLGGGEQRSFLLGTNQIGQDVFSRLIYGTRVALQVGFSAAMVALVIGVPLGLMAGFWSGPAERILTIVMDSLYSFPGLILAITITAVLGPGLLNVIGAIAALYVPTYYRIVRAQTLAVKEELYVEAARSLGVPPLTLLARYIFPNVIPSIVVIFSVNVADAILTEAGLSFLGLGLPPDTPAWGIDLAIGQDLLRQAWWLVTFPGVMIVIVVLGFSMLGESLSEMLNPRLREN